MLTIIPVKWESYEYPDQAQAANAPLYRLARRLRQCFGEVHPVQRLAS